MNREELLEYTNELEIEIEQMQDVIDELKEELEDGLANIGYEEQRYIIERFKKADFKQFQSTQDIIDFILFHKKGAE